MESHPQELSPSKCRKKARNPEKWKKKIQQKARYSPQGLPQFPTCGHNKGAYQCATLKMNQIMKFHKQFYAEPKKLKQNVLLIKYCKTTPVKRTRPKNGMHKRKEHSTTYHVPTAFGLLPVCQKSFLNILNISRRRVDSAVKQFRKTGTSPKETRGGDTRSSKYLQQKVSVINFIKSLNCSEPHYCRGKSNARRYLSSELSVNKLFKMYNDQAAAPLKVKRSFFRDIFCRHFNLGFGSPVTDACSDCISLQEKIKVEKDANKKSDLIIKLRVHKLRAKAFFSMVSEEKPEMITFCFDCEKNLVLPKVPDQSCYYSRQWHLHNFTITVGSSHAKLNVHNSFAYVWTEDEYAKDSNTIASAVCHRLRNTDFKDKTHVRLISDGCGGQNKNSILISAVSDWLLNDAPRNIEFVEIIFPVTGHSFLPPDRVFGNVEKLIRKSEVIENPKGYIDKISQFATVIKVGEFGVKDYRAAAKSTLKGVSSWNMKITQCKKFILKRMTVAKNVKVRGESFYKTDLGSFHIVTKPGLTYAQFQPETVPRYNILSNPLKVRDVKKLLTVHWGDNWEDYDILKFYKELFARIEQDGAPENPDVDADDPENYCCPIDEPPELLV